jgi:hypothetical protein
METTLGRNTEYRRLAATGSPPAFFPLKCEHRLRHWLAAVRENKGYHWQDGAMPRSRDD